MEVLEGAGRYWSTEDLKVLIVQTRRLLSLVSLILTLESFFFYELKTRSKIRQRITIDFHSGLYVKKRFVRKKLTRKGITQ